jgi:large subunit ribosomal protein L13
MLVIDGKNAILGRMATQVAKKLLQGEEVSIINAEKIIITGDPASIKKKYHFRRSIGSPHHGPFFPKQSNLIVRRAIRGMLPYKTNKGRAAFKRLRIYTSVPEELKNKKAENIAVKEIRTNYITIAELSKAIGGK